MAFFRNTEVPSTAREQIMLVIIFLSDIRFSPWNSEFLYHRYNNTNNKGNENGKINFSSISAHPSNALPNIHLFILRNYGSSLLGQIQVLMVEMVCPIKGAGLRDGICSSFAAQTPCHFFSRTERIRGH